MSLTLSLCASCWLYACKIVAWPNQNLPIYHTFDEIPTEKKLGHEWQPKSPKNCSFESDNHCIRHDFCIHSYIGDLAKEKFPLARKVTQPSSNNNNNRNIYKKSVLLHRPAHTQPRGYTLYTFVCIPNGLSLIFRGSIYLRIVGAQASHFHLAPKCVYLQIKLANRNELLCMRLKHNFYLDIENVGNEKMLT